MGKVTIKVEKNNGYTITHIYRENMEKMIEALEYVLSMPSHEEKMTKDNNTTEWRCANGYK